MFEDIIGYKFRNSLLLAEALTHPSLAYETQKPHFDNQRLEFLGDAVIQLVLTQRLYEMFPSFSEGRLTKLRARLVSREALCQFAKDIDLGEFIMMGKGEDASGGRSRPSTLADAFESLMGAIYLDGGLEEATKVIDRVCREKIDHIAESPEEKNPKGKLQEQLQALASVGPTYEVVEESGPDHQKCFEVVVLWQGKKLGRGKGSSKKDAETQAALEALDKSSWKD